MILLDNAVIDYINTNFKKTIRHNSNDEGTLLGLPYTYTVPCPEDVFLEMYYWDTYFTNVGLIADGNIELAKNNIDNMLYMVEKYGFMPNGNRTYYLTRSQPPFLYLGVKDIFSVTNDKEWLRNAYKTLKIEYEFWQTKRIYANGLNFYGNHNFPDSEVEKSYEYFLERCKGFTTEDYSVKKRIAHTMKSFCESGWDCNSRFEFDGENYIPVDLNSLLYGFEKQMFGFCEILSIQNEKHLWIKRAKLRKERMIKYLWNQEKRAFVDYNLRENRFSPVLSAASVYPFYVGLSDNKGDFENLFSKLFLKYGVSASTKENSKGYQWDYPNIWSPVQYISFVGAMNCGLNETAECIKNTYIELIESVFEKNNSLWEKYDGNLGIVANQDYNSPKMLGWTSGIYLYFINR